MWLVCDRRSAKERTLDHRRDAASARPQASLAPDGLIWAPQSASHHAQCRRTYRWLGVRSPYTSAVTQGDAVDRVVYPAGVRNFDLVFIAAEVFAAWGLRIWAMRPRSALEP